MSASATSAATKLSKVQMRVLALLAISVCINYIDRGTLSVAAPSLTRELTLSPKDLGILFSAFFWTYASCLVFAGWLVDRYDVRWVFGIGYLLWSGATLATGFVSTFTTLLMFRLLLGIGESVAYPSYSKILAGNFPQQHRGIANGFIDMASKVGPALGTLVGGLLVANHGWRSLFIWIGVASLIWLPPWAIWGPRDHVAVKAATTAKAPGILKVLKRRDAWGTFLGLFGVNYLWYFLLTWLPSYLVQERHFSVKMMAIVGSLPFWGIAASAMFCGWASDRLIARGASATTVRKAFVATGLLSGILLLPAAMVEDRIVCMGLLVIVSLAFGASSSNNWAITQTLAGPRASGQWTGMQNAFGNLAGVIAPYLTGLIVTATGSFYWAFVATVGAAVVGALAYVFLIGHIAPIDWDEA